eukprot:437120-Rhodomonas_salina.5
MAASRWAGHDGSLATYPPTLAPAVRSSSEMSFANTGVVFLCSCFSGQTLDATERRFRNRQRATEVAVCALICGSIHRNFDIRATSQAQSGTLPDRKAPESCTAKGNCTLRRECNNILHASWRH